MASVRTKNFASTTVGFLFSDDSMDSFDMDVFITSGTVKPSKIEEAFERTHAFESEWFILFVLLVIVVIFMIIGGVITYIIRNQ